MNRPDLASEAVVVRSHGPNDVGRIIDLAMVGRVTRSVLAARGSRSPPR